MSNPQKILILEDEEVGRNLLVRILRNAGYEVIETADPVTALYEVRYSKPDLLLIDYNLGASMNGAEVAECTHHYVPAMPIVMMTADMEIKSEQVPQVREIIRKPYDIDDLVAVLRRHLS